MMVVDDILKILERIPLWKKLTALPTRVDALEKRLAELEASKAPDQDSVVRDGALFKRNSDGSWQNTVYCPNCKTGMSKFPAATGEMTFICSHCGGESGFSVQELPEMLKKLSD